MRSRSSGSRSAGQAIAEFLVVVAALAIALFYPYLQGKSVTVLLLQALLESFRTQSWLLSIV